MFYGGKITAYPCLGFFQLNNDGFVGGCEGDLKSAMTMLVMGYLTGRPGYHLRPGHRHLEEPDHLRPLRVHQQGLSAPAGRANPYHIRSHSEDRKGAVVRSLMPLGEMTTTLEFDPDKKEILFHQAKTVANIDEDKACRTKLAAEVKGHQQADGRVGPLGLAPGHFLRRPAPAGRDNQRLARVYHGG